MNYGEADNSAAVLRCSLFDLSKVLGEKYVQHHFSLRRGLAALLLLTGI